MRADQLLVDRGLAASRSQAQRLIVSGVEWRLAFKPWQRVTKNGDVLPPTCELRLLDSAEARYVSRGGLKLEGALRDSGVVVAGLRCLDVGHDQLHAKLRDDVRVVCVERINARELQADDARVPQVREGFDVVVGDVSFISLTLVLPALLPLLKQGGALLMLVKPQFELQPSNIGKGGLVKDEASYAQVETRLREACAALRLEVTGYWHSAIAGGDGNKEFWIGARRA